MVICKHIDEVIPTSWVNPIFPLEPEDEIRLLCLDRVYGNIQQYELFALMTVLKSIKAKYVFEIGTFDGRTTRNMGANISPGGWVYTLDLPVTYGTTDTTYKLDDQETSLVLGSKSGWRYKGTEEAKYIRQLYGDSAVFDFSDYAGKMDLVFVDGSHAYDYVRFDTVHAFEMVCPQKGIVVWHDYGDEFPEVKSFLHQLAGEKTNYTFYHLQHTLLVVAAPS
jgi:hypothetical protein